MKKDAVFCVFFDSSACLAARLLAAFQPQVGATDVAPVQVAKVGEMAELRGIAQRLDGGVDAGHVVGVLLDAVGDKGEVVAGILSRLGGIANGAVAGNDAGRVQLHALLESRQPGDGVAFGKDAENAVDVDVIAGKQDALPGQPDDRVAGEMGVGKITQFHLSTAGLQAGEIARCRPGGNQRFGAGHLRAERGGQRFDLATAEALLGRHRFFQRDDFGALALEIGVAQPAVILAAGVDHPAHGLAGQLFDFFVEQSGGLQRGARINEDGAFRRIDHAVVGVEPEVFRQAPANRADQRINTIAQFFRLEDGRIGQGGGSDKQAGKRQPRAILPGIQLKSPKKREAEGMEAIGAAPGLAAARVMTVTADAKQKQGMAEAQVIEATSLAEANGMKAKFDAEAQGKEKLGLAEVQVRTAGAEATIKVGDADAQTVQARFSAEAKGLREKFEAMKAMSPETRDHEEFRMRLEMLHTETLKGIEAQMAIAKEQAEVLGKALANAKIEMVGGDGSYFESFVNALAVGKGIDGAIAKSDTLKIALKDHLNGDRNMVDDVGRLVGALGDSSSELKDLAIASLLNKTGKDGKGGGKAV